jgi:hypothetical protein
MSKIKLTWSKQDEDWKVSYPDNAGRSLMGVLFEMTKTTGHRVDWEQDLIKMLTDRGFDYTTFTITCNKLPCTE